MLELAITQEHAPRHRTLDPGSNDRPYRPAEFIEATPVSAHAASANALATDQHLVIAHWLRDAKRRSTLQSSLRGSAPNPDLAA